MSSRNAVRVVAVVAMILAGCSARAGQPDVDQAGEPRTATLRVLEGVVDVAPGGSGFAAGGDGQTLRVGDVVRTAADGRAAIEWFDGSVTRLDRGTTFALTAVEQSATGGTVIEGEQSSGGTYHRVTALTEAGSRFDVVTPTATASVQGTVFAVVFGADGSTTFAVFEGTVLVGADRVAVVAGFMVVVGPDGAVGEARPISDEFLEADWILYNECELDGAIGCAPPTPERIELSPARATIAVGETQHYTVEAFGAEGESLGVVTAAATIEGPGCTGASCAPETPGEHRITAEYQGLEAQATLVVEAGPIVALRVLPESATAPAGVRHSFTALGLDGRGNPTGPVEATFTIVGGSCHGGECSSTRAGEHLVTATFEGATGSATLTVKAGPLSYLGISPEAATITAGETQEFTVKGHDAYGNSRGAVSAVFDIDDGSCQGNTCTSTAPGERVVTATHAGLSATATLTVVPGPPSSITLEHLGEVATEEQLAAPGQGGGFGGDSALGGLVIGCEAHVFRATVTDAYGNPVDFVGEVLFGDVDGGETANIAFVAPDQDPQFGVLATEAVAGVAEVVVVGWADGAVTLVAWIDEQTGSNAVVFGVSGGCAQLD